MPGRKSNISSVSVGPEDVAESTPVRSTREGMSVEDLSLPKSMIARLAKGVLPANTQIHKDALLALHKSATVFVSYIAANSSENAHSSGKKTIAPPDVIAALKDAEFEDFLPRLEAELKKYNDTQCDKRNTYRRKVKEEKAAAATHEGESEGPKDGDAIETLNGAANGHVNADDVERPAKKFKGEAGEAVALEPGAADDEGHEDADDDVDEDEDVEDDVEDDEVDDDDVPDEALADTVEEVEERGGLRDEALDEPDSE